MNQYLEIISFLNKKPILINIDSIGAIVSVNVNDVGNSVGERSNIMDKDGQFLFTSEESYNEVIEKLQRLRDIRIE